MTWTDWLSYWNRRRNARRHRGNLWLIILLLIVKCIIVYDSCYWESIAEDYIHSCCLRIQDRASQFLLIYINSDEMIWLDIHKNQTSFDVCIWTSWFKHCLVNYNYMQKWLKFLRIHLEVLMKACENFLFYYIVT